MPEISVIVPVYNVENYLVRCADSILAQTYTDFELILVDDGSPDNCGLICDKYGQKDSRVHVIHQENRGVSAARNAGLNLACGTYVTFIDSDDWIKPDYLEKLICYKADLVCETGILIDEKTLKETRRSLKSDMYNTSDENLELLLLDGTFDFTCAKLFLLEKIRQNCLRFDERIDFAEDTLFAVQYAKCSENICVADEANYCYMVYKSRRTLSNTFSTERLEELKKANKLISKAVCSDAERADIIYQRRMIYAYISFLRDNAFSAGNHSFIKTTKILFYLKNQEDFLDLNKSVDLGFPPVIRSALSSRKKFRIVLAQIYCFLARIKNKLIEKAGDKNDP